LVGYDGAGGYGYGCGGHGGAGNVPSPFWPMSLAGLFALPTNLNINKFSHSPISES